MQPQSFFELKTPRDMLKKAERELIRLQADFSIDNIFNFFVTAYHVRDYVEEARKVSTRDLDSFFSDPDLQACQALCNKGKHMRLSGHPNAMTDIASGGYGCHSFGEAAFGEGDIRRLFYADRAVDVRSLPARVIQKWDQFLLKNGL